MPCLCVAALVIIAFVVAACVVAIAAAASHVTVVAAIAAVKPVGAHVMTAMWLLWLQMCFPPLSYLFLRRTCFTSWRETIWA